MNTTTARIDPKNPADAELLRNCLAALWPDSVRHMRPAAGFAERHCWESAGGRGCWLAFEQSAWTDNSWGWQSAEPNAQQRKAMRCEPCEVGGWLTYDVVSIGD